MLFGYTARNCVQQRNKLVESAKQGEFFEPTVDIEPQRVEKQTWASLERARTLSEDHVAADIYGRRLDDIELDFLLLESLGQPKRLRPIAARRFGTGASVVDIEHSKTTLGQLAKRMLVAINRNADPAVVPARSDTGYSLERLVLGAAGHVGLDIDVRVEPGLTANAAAGDRTVFLSDRLFGRIEARRVAVHEVFGHLVSAYNGRTQPFGIFAIGTGNSFEDQEGVAIYLEEIAGLLDGNRLRMLAARVLVTDAMHQGARFGAVVRHLMIEHGFEPAQAVALCQRAFRGGGVARDAVYLRGWLRVRRAILAGQASLAELQIGKVSLGDLPTIRLLRQEGLVRDGIYTPSFERSLGITGAGTSLDTSPPSFVTSLTKLDAT